MSDADVDTTAARAYESALVPGLFGPWSEAAVGWLEISEGEHILDIACGAGAATRPAAKRAGPSGRAVGVDNDAGMIALARSTSVQAGGSALEWHCASVQQLPFDGHSFDGALCIQGLQFFPDRIAALREIRRVLKPEGRLLALVWCSLERCKGFWAMVRALERRGIDTTASHKPYSLGPEGALTDMLRQAGFTRSDITVERKLAQFRSAEAFIDSVARGGPASRLTLAKVPSHDWPAFVAEVSAELRPYVDGPWLRFPMESYVIQARN
jgi:SAM-dependent methyltransferase